MLHDDVVRHVRTLLVEGRIPPGAKIREREICAELGISRTPLREALKVLAAEGYVELLPHRGARAALLTAADMEHLFEACAALESAAGELACARISDAEVDRIAALHREMTGHFAEGELRGYFRCNRAIHEALVAAAGNPVLAGMYEAVSARIRRARYVAPMPPANWQQAMREHDAMLNALLRRDGAVLALVLKTHLRNKRAEVEQAGFSETGLDPSAAGPADTQAP